ncbi:MAG: hypothetical protein O3A36_03135 [bacterium]|nr:hypothetical protein [bacterium]
MVLLFIASALIGSGILFHHKRVLTYIAVAGALFEAEILLTTLLHRTVGQSLSGTTFYLLAGVFFTTIWGALYSYWKSPYSVPGSGKRDAYVGVALLFVLLCAYPIISRNGYVGEDFVMHGFYNGDVATFGSLIQKSFNTPSLVQANPFSANGSLEYPTLLHASVANFFSLLGIGKDWLYYLGLMTYAQIVLTIPLFFLLWDITFPEPKNRAEKWFGLESRNKVYALQAILALIAVTLSIDTFVFPQSHFFLMGIFLTVIALFANTAQANGKEQIISAIPAFTLALLLLLANTVTGTVAIALAGTLCLLRIFDKKRTVKQRALFLSVGFLLLLCMKYASAGRTELNNLHFSVSSAGDMLRTGLPALFVLGAALHGLSRKQFLSVATSITCALGFLVFFLSNRNIVTENASRFLYHGFLIGHILLLPLAIQLMYWVKREVLYTTRPISEKIAGNLLVLSACLILLMPIGISFGNTYKSLVAGDKHIVNVNTRIALSWIEDNTPSNAVIITNPNEPYIVPLFTGRAMVRATDYWLSADDDTSITLQKAFAGDKAAQKETLFFGSYLYLNKEDQTHWDISALKKVADTGDVKVYEIK